ncbi:MULTISPECIES: cysteine desulfurase family protein [unclassified Bacillus (in: firmicutes)]|uniref:cysteine desulfurase family protein n=1 Tax=unclassified Bacillus (in: firmicutes) TaxID=185979 RepID=UPI0008DFC410|nr:MULTISPECIES: cysteine desulfurase family protein [unclassified Bacillus (in: firmicutes)]SFH95139.1 cysteine desulfurase [Bacillus sp. 71mf]SFS95163.1 cysteine desulfurase [Bacillus sp. 103mf]
MRQVYLDYAATTPCHNKVVEVVEKYMKTEFANPSSQHVMGKKAQYAVEQAKSKIGISIGADKEEIIFTSGATESNNLALLGAVDYYEKEPVNVILSPIDHKSILGAGKELQRRGIIVKYVDINRDGTICLDSLRYLLDDNTRVVSFAYVNSEVGTIQPINEISALCRKYQTLIHVDAVQAFGKIPIDVKKLDIDALSLSGHKIYGPKGIGVLYVNQHKQKDFRPLLFGGEQTYLRSGTLPTSLIAGMGVASDIAVLELEENYEKVKRLRTIVVKRIQQEIPHSCVNVCMENSIPHIINIMVPNISSETLIAGMRTVSISSGSACNSSSLEPSYVLQEIGLTKEEANSSIRISISPYLSEEEVLYAVDEIVAKIKDIYCVQQGF